MSRGPLTPLSEVALDKPFTVADPSSPPLKLSRAERSNHSETQPPTSKEKIWNHLTVREKSAWFDKKTNGMMILAVLAPDGRVVKVPMNELEDSW